MARLMLQGLWETNNVLLFLENPAIAGDDANMTKFKKSIGRNRSYCIAG